MALDLATERDLHGQGYVGLAACRRCHEEHYRTWHRTFHRTMTQEVSARNPGAGRYLQSAQRSHDRQSLAVVARARRGFVRALPRPAHRRPRRSLPRSRRPLRARRRFGAVERAAVARHADGRRARAVRPALLGHGTARLTAYEYQGLLQSPCTQRGALTCTTCHGMHHGDPRGQLRPDAIGDGACVGCHRELSDAEARSRHSHHAGDATTCVDCHMPRVVYGGALMSTAATVSRFPTRRARRRTAVPMPVRAVTPTRHRHGRPPPCAAGGGTATTHPRRRPPMSPRWPREVRNPLSVPSWIRPARKLLSGDPIERAVAADALGRTRAPAAPPRGRYGLVCCWTPWPTTAIRRCAIWRPARSAGWSRPCPRSPPTTRTTIGPPPAAPPSSACARRYRRRR